MKNSMKWFKLVGSLVICIAGVGITLLGNSLQNAALIVFGILILGGGVLLTRQSLRNRTMRLIGSDNGEKEDSVIATNPPNSHVIRKHTVGFEYVETPPGQQQKCYNDNQLYYPLIEKDGGLVEFQLPDAEPDEMHYDPNEFANPVTMSLNAKYFSWNDSLFQKISIAVMGIVIGGEIIGIIAMM